MVLTPMALQTGQTPNPAGPAGSDGSVQGDVAVYDLTPPVRPRGDLMLI